MVVLAEKTALAERPGEEMPGPPNIWVTFLTGIFGCVVDWEPG